MSESQLKEIKEKLLNEYKRYVINLEIVLALKYLIINDKLLINIIPPERKVIIKDKKTLRSPDLILHDNEAQFVLNEIKTSLNPSKDKYQQILDYLNIEAILDDNGKKNIPKDFSVNLILDMESYSGAREFIYTQTENNIQENFSLTRYHLNESVKNGVRYYWFELKDGETVINSFNELLRAEKLAYEINWQREGEELYFISEPKVQYTITILWTIIIPIIKEKETFTFNLAEEYIKDYYCRWDENTIYYRRDWLRNAIEELINIGWIKETTKETYTIVKTLDLNEDTKDIICEKLAKLEIPEKKEKKKKEEKSIQVDLDHFFKNT